MIQTMFPAPAPLSRFPAGEPYRLIPACELPEEGDATLAARVAAVCNQGDIYAVLFAQRCKGEPYALADAERFLTWARRGWRDGTHFVFLIVRDADGELAGAIDIKSADRTAPAEIGYWLAVEHSGVMTSAVEELCRLACAAGYRELFGLVRAGNDRSAAVLERTGFRVTETLEKDGRAYRRFSLPL